MPSLKDSVCGIAGQKPVEKCQINVKSGLKIEKIGQETVSCLPQRDTSCIKEDLTAKKITGEQLRDYNSLLNKPTLNGRPLVGEIMNLFEFMTMTSEEVIALFEGWD